MAKVKRGTHRQANGAPSHPAGFILALTWFVDTFGISSTVPLVNRAEKLALRPDVIAANAVNLFDAAVASLSVPFLVSFPRWLSQRAPEYRNKLLQQE
ncbi:hypothetical protein A8A54_19495 [Brucella pseudogrignonensis]|nr:hypothetical protein A8A54_19495 [Brucella pseudogrignonensis]